MLGGFLTNCCVESTMRSAYEKGYDVITLTDCTAATTAEEQQSATWQDYRMFSQPLTSDEAVGMLQDTGEVVDASRAYSS
jgi:ureidoacrylate peracid hydrolase